MTTLDAWLGALGISSGARFGEFVVERAAVRHERVELELARAAEVVMVHVTSRNAKAPAFARTPSYDLSYVPVQNERMASTLALMTALTSVITARDRGDGALPSETTADRDAGARSLDAIPRVAREFAFVEVEASDLAGHSDAMHEMFERRLDAMIIRDVFPREQMAAIAAELERPGAAFDFRDNTQSDERDHAQPYNLGQVLIPTRTYPAGAPLDVYFRTAEHFRRTCRELFSRGFGPEFEPRVESVLRSVAGGRPVSIPRGPSGESYTPATIRAVPPHAELAVHVGNYFKDCDAYGHLATFVELDDQLSYFVPIATADAGGEIEVFSLEWQHRPRTARGDLDVEAIARESPSTKFRPRAGDMFLFDGGRYYHRVCRVEGAGTRWTIGGFVTISKEHREYYYWS